MIKAVISRLYNPTETKGAFLILDGDALLYECKVIELPFKDNLREVSCILEGIYDVIKITKENGKQVFLLLDVSGREGIEIHVGNYINGDHPDTKGCILPGTYFTDVNQDGYIDIANSSYEMKKLLEILPDKFKLHIL
jgi:hypothetical protein